MNKWGANFHLSTYLSHIWINICQMTIAIV